MARVLGIGGVFFKSKDPGTLANWYRDVIGLELEDWGGIVFRPEAMAAQPGAATVFSPFAADTTYFAPSTKDFMINLAVDDLDAILAELRQAWRGGRRHARPAQRPLRARHRPRGDEDRAVAAAADAGLTARPGAPAS